MLTLAVTYAALLGGAERSLVDFAQGLPGEVVLACPDGPLAERARAEQFTVFTLPGRSLELRGSAVTQARAGYDLARHARDVERLARSLAPDLVLTWGMRSTIAAPAALARIRPRPALLARHVDFLPGPVVGRAMRAATARADRVCVNSRAVARDLYPEDQLGERMSVIPPGVDLAAYDPTWAAGAHREVLLLGALVDWKRPELALESVALAARELPDLRLTLAGAPMGTAGDRLLATLRRRAERDDLAGRVRFAGELADPRVALRSAWCLLHCAEREPFGRVVLEALASGRPVVAPADGGPAEIVDGSCGRLYPPGNAAAAAAALVDVLASPERARTLGAGGPQRAKRYDADDARRRFASEASRAVADRDAAGAGRKARPAPAGRGLAIVTVTHNSGPEVVRLLRSVERHLPGAQVVVIDSGSSDGSASAARGSVPGAEVVELEENVGFGRASNAGVALAREPVCVLLNPDIELVDDSLAALARDVSRARTRERILGPLALRPDGSVQDTAQLEPGSTLLLLKALLPPTAAPGPLRRRLDPWRSRRPRRVAWAAACCLVARTATLRRLGPFDERIFLFGEDTELGMRAAEQGVETWFRPDARVLHLDAHSTGPAFGGEAFDLLARQRRAVVGERRGPRVARRDHAIWLLTFLDRILLKALTGRSTWRERRQLAAQWRARDAPARL